MLENADLSHRFDHIYVRWHYMYHVPKIGCDIRNCFYFPAHFNERVEISTIAYELANCVFCQWTNTYFLLRYINVLVNNL